VESCVHVYHCVFRSEIVDNKCTDDSTGHVEQAIKKNQIYPLIEGINHSLDNNTPSKDNDK
jgi:hypothetical protein